MRAQQLDGPSRLVPVEVAAPGAADLGEGDVLLAVRAGGICGSDLPAFRGLPVALPSLGGGWLSRGPGHPLHEVAGEVLASRHPAHAPGDLVVGWASRSDGLAEVVVTAGDGLAAHDPALPATTAVALQPLACALHAVDRLGDVRGRHVAVLGQGPTGLLFSHVLAARGAARVTGVDVVDRRGEAELFGVDDTVTATGSMWAAEIADADRPDVVVEAVGHQVTTLTDCVRAVAVEGLVYVFGIPDDPVHPLELRTVLRKRLTLRAGDTAGRRAALAAAGEHLARHPALAAAYVTHRFPLDDAQRAFETAARPRPGQLKVVLEP